MFIAALFTIAKTWNQPKCPSMIDRTGKILHIYTMEYYAAIKKDEFVSFVGTWMNLENIILSKLTQEQKIKYRIFSLIGGWWTMRTHGHREGSTTHWDLLGGIREGQRGVSWGGIALGRNAKCGWRGGRQQNTLPCVYLCNYLACSAHVPPRPKMQLKNFLKISVTIQWNSQESECYFTTENTEVRWY